MSASTSDRMLRPLLLPGILGGIAMIATVGLIDTDGFVWAQGIATVLALILAVLAVQQRRWWWALPAVAIAVLWNPIVPFALVPEFWFPAHYVAAAVFLALGLVVRVPESEYNARTGTTPAPGTKRR